MRYTFTLGFPSASTMATRWSSPPDRVFTFIGFTTSLWNCALIKAALICFNKSMRTVPGNLGEIVCGLSDTAMLCLSAGLSGSSPASRRTKVVFPVPFSPSMTMISESVNEPSWTVNLKPPSCLVLSTSISSAVSTILKERDSSRKRKFSVGMKPSRKILMPAVDVSDRQ
ncbi:hypothetical protein BJY52DRAFT_1204294 [Lactarius psammicola]|nr:hypothetical protein BJY52DRAFT_1204294 [Lactarius psammicola]